MVPTEAKRRPREKEDIVFRTTSRRVGFLAALLALGLVAAACSNGADAASGDGGGEMSLSIATPQDGAKVSEPFTLKVDSSVPLGDPETGEHHVHLCFDGASCDSEYTLVYSDTFQITDLSPGMHTIEASLRNADHSDAGPSATIQVDVTGAGAGTTGGTTTSPSASSNGGYGY
jgi:hypothetical protein